MKLLQNVDLYLHQYYFQFMRLDHKFPLHFLNDFTHIGISYNSEVACFKFFGKQSRTNTDCRLLRYYQRSKPKCSLIAERRRRNLCKSELEIFQSVVTCRMTPVIFLAFIIQNSDIIKHSFVPIIMFFGGRPNLVLGGTFISVSARLMLALADRSLMFLVQKSNLSPLITKQTVVCINVRKYFTGKNFQQVLQLFFKRAKPLKFDPPSRNTNGESFLF